MHKNILQHFQVGTSAPSAHACRRPCLQL